MLKFYKKNNVRAREIRIKRWIRDVIRDMIRHNELEVDGLVRDLKKLGCGVRRLTSVIN